MSSLRDSAQAFSLMRRRRLRPKDEERQDRPLEPAKARERVFQRAAKLLAAKQRSIEELRERLLEGRGATKANVEEVIARLRERPLGRRRLQRDLWLKKVDKQTAESALDEVFEATPEAELIDRAIAKRIRLRGKPKNREDAKRLFDHLLRQGFEFELVSERVRRTVKSADEDDSIPA